MEVTLPQRSDVENPAPSYVPEITSFRLENDRIVERRNEKIIYHCFHSTRGYYNWNDGSGWNEGTWSDGGGWENSDWSNS